MVVPPNTSYLIPHPHTSFSGQRYGVRWNRKGKAQQREGNEEMRRGNDGTGKRKGRKENEGRVKAVSIASSFNDALSPLQSKR